MTLRSKVLRGSIWVVAFRWVSRLLGIVNVAIIARILSPEDFGLVAMAMLVMAFIEAWLAFGLENACVQRRELRREHLDTAWSMRLIQGGIVTLLIAASAPLAAIYFREERVTLLLWILCSGILIGSLANIGVVMFRRDMDFQSEFKLQFGARVIGFAIGIVAALALRNYWALVIGILAGITATTMISYLMHPFRPRWDLSCWRELWTFSKWMFVVNIAQFAESRADEAIVGRLGADAMGLYSVASDFGQMPANEIAAPVNRVLFPAFASVQGDLERLKSAYLRTLEVVAAVTFPTGVGLALVARPAIEVLLGAKWVKASGVLALIAIFAVFRSVASTSTSVMFALGRPRLVAYVSLLGLLLFVALSFPLVRVANLEGIAAARTVSGLVSALACLWTVCRLCGLRLGQVLASLFRPFFSVSVMAAVLLSLPDVAGLSPLAELAAEALIGVLVFVIAMACTWLAVGKPDGPERELLIALSKRFSTK